MRKLIPVYATPQTDTYHELTNEHVGCIRVAFKRPDGLWQIGATVARGKGPAISNLILDIERYEFVGSLREASKG